MSTARISGHVNTIESESLPERRRRQRYSEEFKAQVVAACQGIGVSVAAVALEHRLNANLLRRWIDQAEGRLPRRPLGRPPATPPSLPAFVPVPLGTPDTHSSEIRIEVRRGGQSITVSWPTSEAAQCAAWLREWLA
ncbi:IS66-like element accessory protein TnpA [Paraburkholderia sp. GAS206C]|uniref:IS66-like element accessory protein TnpA n=1 Tax=Paraburkholderia sp. GAS206C TaxID=3035128 RepID=UPI003D1B504B